VRENCTPRSVPGQSDNWLSYGDDAESLDLLVREGEFMSQNWLKRLFGPSIQALELAPMLFCECVLADEGKVMSKYFDSYKNQPGFHKPIFERKVFTYLVANIAIALTNASCRDWNMIIVIKHFKELVSSEMNTRWGATLEDVDGEIEDAATKFAELLYTNPSDNRAISFEWSQNWLKDMGIHEYNPITLFEISQTWKIYHIYVADFLSRIKLCKGSA
jgi:hypothetical protein